MRNSLGEQREWITEMYEMEMYEMDKSEAELKPTIMDKKGIKARLEKIIHEDHNLITTIEAQKAIIKIIGLLDEYTQQVSKEVAIDFILHYSQIRLSRKIYGELFDDWQKQK